jgi:hypothetical protein
LEQIDDVQEMLKVPDVKTQVLSVVLQKAPRIDTDFSSHLDASPPSSGQHEGHVAAVVVGSTVVVGMVVVDVTVVVEVTVDVVGGGVGGTVGATQI